MVGEWLGPLHRIERVRAARGRWLHASRVIFLLGLLATLWWVHQAADLKEGRTSPAELAAVGGAFTGAVTGIGLLAAMLVGPATMAGSVCQERARGNFDLYLASGLTSGQIVFGKLLGRLWPVLGAMAAVAPALCIATMLGGVDPEGLLGSFLSFSAIAVFMSSLTLMFAFRTNKAHEALTAAYFLAIVFFACVPLSILIAEEELFGSGAISKWLSPLYPLAAEFNEPDEIARGPWGLSTWNVRLIGLAELLVASLAFAAIAAWRLSAGLQPRIVKSRSHRTRRAETARAQARDSARLDRDPVYWREIRRRRSTRAMGWVGWSMRGLTILGTATAVIMILVKGTDNSQISLFIFTFLIWSGQIAVSAVAPTALADERSRGGLDVLATTLLTPLEIVWGKWRASWRLVGWLAVPPAAILLTFLISRPTEERFAFGAAIGVPTRNPGNAPLPGTSAAAKAVVAASKAIVRFEDAVEGPALVGRLLPEPVAAVVRASQPSAFELGSAMLLAFEQSRIAPREVSPFPSETSVANWPTRRNALIHRGAPPAEAATVALVDQIVSRLWELENRRIVAAERKALIVAFKTTLGYRHGRWLAALTLMGSLLVSGAFLSILGLAIAARVQQPSWANGMTMGCVMLGSFALSMPLFFGDGGSGNREFGLTLSPISGPTMLAERVCNHTHDVSGSLMTEVRRSLAVNAAYLVATLVLFAFAVRSMDRGLGRAGSIRRRSRLETTPPSPHLAAPATLRM